MYKVKSFIKNNKSIYFFLKSLINILKGIKVFGLNIKDYFEVLVIKKNEIKIFYFGVPQHSNLGDLAQCVCIRKWINDNYPDRRVIECKTDVVLDNEKLYMKLIKSKCNKNDLIFFQSGYCTHDIWLGREDLMHQVVFKYLQENYKVILPQTVCFIKESRKQQAKISYNSQKDKLLFMARDDISYQYAKELFNDVTVIKFPDIVTSLIGSFKYNNERSGILLCCRNDIEKYYSDKELNELKNRLFAVEKIDVVDTTTNKSFKELNKDLWKNIKKFIDNFSNYKVVITDRYHGTIFSVITNTPVVVIKSNDHKVVTGVNWFKNYYDNICIAEDLDDAYNKALKYLWVDTSYNNTMVSFNEKYYMELKTIIDNWISNKR